MLIAIAPVLFYIPIHDAAAYAMIRLFLQCDAEGFQCIAGQRRDQLTRQALEGAHAFPFEPLDVLLGDQAVRAAVCSAVLRSTGRLILALRGNIYPGDAADRFFADARGVGLIGVNMQREGRRLTDPDHDSFKDQRPDARQADGEFLAVRDAQPLRVPRRGMQMALGDDGGFAADDPVACLDMDLGRVLQVTREPDGGLKAKLARVGRGDLRLRLLSQGAQPLALTKEIVADFHAHGVEVCPWTVDEPKDMQRLIDLGVDGLLTNRIDTVWF